MRSIDTEMVNAYWNIGRDIVEEEQNGQERAEYGSFILKELSQKLASRYGKGFGITTLKDIRQFYIVYEDRIRHALRGESPKTPNQKSLQPILGGGFKLGWIQP